MLEGVYTDGSLLYIFSVLLFFVFFCTRDRGVFFVCFVTAEGCPLYSIDLFRYLGGEFGLGKGGGNLLGCGDWLMRWCAYQINMKQSINQTNKQTNKL